jgi:DNA repair exonuclease SbcCD nuclease subunit
MHSLPRADYYALAHLHINFEEKWKDKYVIYSGPIYPNSFQELQDLSYGRFYIVDVGGFVSPKKKEIVQSKLDEDTKDQAGSILDEINKTDSEIRKANFNAGREKNSTKRDEFIANSEFYRGERDVLVERFNALMPQKPAEGATQPAQTEFSQVDQSALDWANANPDDPRSQRIKEKLGVE